MANTKSAKKRILINKRNYLRNRFYKSSVKTFIKSFLNNLEISKISRDFNNKEKTKKVLSSVYSLLDKGTRKKIFHRNAAARKKSRLTNSIRILNS